MWKSSEPYNTAYLEQKSTGVVEASDNVSTPTASVNSSKLKNMLAGVKSE